MGFGRRLRWAALPAFLLIAACASDGDEPPPPPPPPEMGDWPVVWCGSGTVATTLLDQIQECADIAHAALTIDAATHGMITTRVNKCRWDFSPCAHPNWIHCGFVRRARDAAWLGDWPLCLNELEHGH